MLEVGLAGSFTLPEDEAGARPCRPSWSSWRSLDQGDRSGRVVHLGLQFLLVQPVHFAKTTLISKVSLNLPLNVKKY